MSFFLVATAGATAGERIPLTDEVTWVGRIAGANQLVIDRPDISRRHACLRLGAAGEIEIEDHSTNGTFIAGQRVLGSGRLRPGERVRFGAGAEAEFELLAAVGTPASPNATHAPAQTIVATRGAGTKPAAPPGPGPALTCWIEIVEHQLAVRQVEVRAPRLELSRVGGAGRLVIEHPTVSAPHAEISVHDGEAWLRDLESTNGTFVNGLRATRHRLQDGDLIQLGNCDSRLLLFRESAPRTLRLTDVDVSQPQLTIGRGEDNGLRLSHPTVSQHHAEIRNQSGHVTIADLGSTNGTFVNGQPVRGPQPLQPGDRISVGAVQFVFDGSHLEGQAEVGRAALAAQGIVVEVRDRATGRSKLLLDDIWMQIEPGQFVGLLGGSGAGKSTLMDALNGARPASRGRVLINQSDLYREFAAVRSLIGYVPQDDILHTQLTVAECLYYSARLRLPDDFSETALQERVAEVIRVLELTEQAPLAIRQLSGGQRKRVSVGIELLSNPSLLFLDEPTAGQDPKNELQMMQLFRRIANQGESVILNTHLLDSFGLLDRVAVLVGGRLAFYGPAPDMLRYFGCDRPQEIYHRLKEEKTPQEWGAAFRQSDYYTRYAGGLSGGTRQGEIETRAPAAAAPTVAPAKHSALRQLATVASRQLRLKLKDKASLGMLLLPPSVIAALIGIMNLASHGTRTWFPNSPMSLFMSVLVGLWFGCSATVREIVDEAAVYRRERQRELKRGAYVASKLLYLAGLAAVQSGLFLAVMAGLHVLVTHLLAAWLLMWLITLQGGLIGLLISALARSAEQALYVFPLVMIIELLFAGMLIPTAPIATFFPVPQFVQGQVTRLNVVPPPAWLHAANPPMSGYLRNTISLVAVSRWSLEALADLYASDANNLVGCYETQAAESPNYDCGYSIGLLDSVALTLHPRAAGVAAGYLGQVGAALAGGAMPPPAPPRGDRFGGYLGLQALFALIMMALVFLAMGRKEVRHAG